MASMHAERKFHSGKSVEEKKRHRGERLSDINIMEDLRAEVAAAKAESAELRKAVAKANMREAESASERRELLNIVSQMEMDSALDQQKLEEALDELSKSDFVFEQVTFYIPLIQPLLIISTFILTWFLRR